MDSSKTVKTTDVPGSYSDEFRYAVRNVDYADGPRLRSTTMGWINTLFASGDAGEASPANPWDETVIIGAPDNAHKAIGSGAENGITHPDARIAEEIKRRQIALITRYVATVRVR